MKGTHTVSSSFHLTQLLAEEQEVREKSEARGLHPSVIFRKQLDVREEAQEVAEGTEAREEEEAEEAWPIAQPPSVGFVGQFVAEPVVSVGVDHGFGEASPAGFGDAGEDRADEESGSEEGRDAGGGVAREESRAVLLLVGHEEGSRCRSIGGQLHQSRKLRQPRHDLLDQAEFARVRNG